MSRIKSILLFSTLIILPPVIDARYIPVIALKESSGLNPIMSSIECTVESCNASLNYNEYLSSVDTCCGSTINGTGYLSMIRLTILNKYGHVLWGAVFNVSKPDYSWIDVQHLVTTSNNRKPQRIVAMGFPLQLSFYGDTDKTSAIFTVVCTGDASYYLLSRNLEGNPLSIITETDASIIDLDLYQPIVGYFHSEFKGGYLEILPRNSTPSTLPILVGGLKMLVVSGSLDNLSCDKYWSLVYYTHSCGNNNNTFFQSSYTMDVYANCTEANNIFIDIGGISASCAYLYPEYKPNMDITTVGFKITVLGPTGTNNFVRGSQLILEEYWTTKTVSDESESTIASSMSSFTTPFSMLTKTLLSTTPKLASNGQLSNSSLKSDKVAYFSNVANEESRAYRSQLNDGESTMIGSSDSRIDSTPINSKQTYNVVEYTVSLKPSVSIKESRLSASTVLDEYSVVDANSNSSSTSSAQDDVSFLIKKIMSSTLNNLQTAYTKTEKEKESSQELGGSSEDLKFNLDGNYTVTEVTDQSDNTSFNITSILNIRVPKLVKQEKSANGFLSKTDTNSSEIDFKKESHGSVITNHSDYHLGGSVRRPCTSSNACNANKSENRHCHCFCRNLKPIKKSNDTLKDILEKLVKALVIDKTVLSSSTRKKTSAWDSRPSAQAMGALGVGFLITVGLLVLALDIPNIIGVLIALRHTINANLKPPFS